MNVPVEAQSLSSLTNLLANPPQYPRNPTHEVRESLVLYIVRVPGSKDVFLTPLKPPTKASISLEAIQSSLYYLHVSSEEDEEVKKSIDEERRSLDVKNPNLPIQRKPLPPTPYTNYPEHERPPPPPKHYPSYQPGLNDDPSASQAERYAARGSHLRFRSDWELQGQASVVKHVRPRSFHQQPQSNRSSSQSPSRSVGDSPTESSRFERDGKLTILNDKIEDNAGPFSSRTIDDQQELTLKTRNLSNLGNQPLAITLIRRDPVSGGQWNVGTISQQLVTSPSDLPLRPTKIELTTPGYNRFTNSFERSEILPEFADADSIKRALASGELGGDSTDSHGPVNQSFRRTIDYRQLAVTSRHPKIHRRTDSFNRSKPTSPVKQFRNFYSFMSPWQGLCTFVNGIDGKSLKCRHSLKASASFEEDVSANVAELRFNLPWSILSSTEGATEEVENLPISKLIGPKSGREAFKHSIQQFKSVHLDKFSKDGRERISPYEELRSPPDARALQDEQDRLSLRLGREKAGGGFMGTSAKLGKLIILDEGLKMCDLVVAACMGVWWQHYEARNE